MLCTGLIACGGDSNGGGDPGDEDTATQTEANTGPALVDVSDDVEFESVETEWGEPGAATNGGSNSDPGTSPGGNADTDAQTGSQDGSDTGQQDDANTGQQDDTNTGQQDDANTGQQDDTNTGQQDKTGQTDPQNDAPPPERNTLEFNTSPGQATVTIVQEGGDVRREAETPATFEVPPGLYSWTVEREGYAPKESREAIDLETQQSETQTVELKVVEGEKTFLERARMARENENYRQAIDLYRKVPEPDPNQDPRAYLESQMQLGNLHWQQRGNVEAAKQAYQNVIDQDQTRYEAFLNLARMHYENDNHGEVLKNLDRVERLRFQIPAQKRQRVLLRVKYRRALAYFQQAQPEQAPNRRRNAQKARQTLESFLGSVPSNLESDFSREIEEARKKLREIRSLLKNEIR